jgi:3-hydroxyisobutyrate dehydrogenase
MSSPTPVLDHAPVDARPTVGFIGLGNMGSGMTRNLQAAGFPLVVTDLRRESAAGLIDGGARSAETRWADTPREVAASSDLVITMLPTPKHVDAVASGPDGIIAGLADGGTWIDMSTSVPDVLAGVRAAHAHRGLHLLDAPVSGMSVGAANGTLQIFIGGDAEDVERLRPVFEAMGDQLWFSHLVATAEVLSVGVAAGVDLGVLREALVASPANSTFVSRDVLSILDHGDYDEGFAIALACKDLGLSVDLARSVGMPVELSSLVEQVFRRARARYGDRAGEMTPVRLYEELLGRDLRREVHA